MIPELSPDTKLTLIVVLAVTGNLLLVWILLAKKWNYVSVMAFLRRAEVHNEKAQTLNDEVWDILPIIKDWAFSARTHSKEASLAVAELTTRREDVKKAVEQVPERTADAVIEKIHRTGDSVVIGVTPAGTGQTPRPVPAEPAA